MDRDRDRNRDRDRDRPAPDRELRDLLMLLRDVFQDAAARIDDYIYRSEAPRPRPVRDDAREGFRDRGTVEARPAPRPRWEAERPNAPAAGAGGEAPRGDLERLRDEVRKVSDDAPSMEPEILRLYIEAFTAEARLLQARAQDADSGDLATRIMRTLTAIVSEYRPGHVYGLARHHSADWAQMAEKARSEIRARQSGEAVPS